MPLHPTERFSSRVGNYVRHRPGYPAEVLELLRNECGLKADHMIADIASGTGIFTRVLLGNGNRVFGVEPNAAMRKAGEEFLASYPRFCSVAGTAEATTLQEASLDFVTAAQAAHWFDREKARREFQRILKPDGWCVLVWNSRISRSSGFLSDYEQLLLDYGTDYEAVRHERTIDKIEEFFRPVDYQFREFPMKQEFDYQGLEGRLLSSSYIPLESDPRHPLMLRDLRRIFDSHQRQGLVALDYTTHVYYGQIARKTPSS